ncbi:Velvet domain containing protein [Pyrenophora tritici-repentis]|nr:Velvet domain containing protein [Pyrenophora tritici-repentis]
MNAVNACRLNDLDGKAGFWFVLQDLSVRTEGTFRLKLSLFDIGSGTNTVVPESQGPHTKFPGVIESTPLSKCFAQQGIKIPIRKDAPKEIVNANEYEADD